MDKKRKAILLSALVFPGLGQLVLRRYKTALILILAVVISLYQFMNIVMQQANEAVNRVMQQGGTLDIQSITQTASQSVAVDSSYTFYLWSLVFCWLISLLDIAFVKHRADKNV